MASSAGCAPHKVRSRDRSGAVECMSPCPQHRNGETPMIGRTFCRVLTRVPAALPALALLAGCAGLSQISQKADYDWGANNCRSRGLTEGTPAFQDCVAGEIRGLHQTWRELDRI